MVKWPNDIVVMGGRNMGRSQAVLVIACLMRLWGWQVQIYPAFSCQYWCPVYPERGMYCGEGCYAMDGFDLSGKDYP